MSNPSQIILPPTSEYLLVLSPDEDLQERIGRIKQVFSEKQVPEFQVVKHIFFWPGGRAGICRKKN